MNLLDEKNIAVLLVFATVIVAGCTDSESGVDFEQTSGVEISTFSIQPSTVFEDQNAQVILELVNRGAAEAESVSYEFFNVPFGEGGNSWTGTQSREVGRLQPADPSTGLQAIPRETTESLTPPDIQRTVTSDLMVAVNYEYETTASTELSLIEDERFRESQPEQAPPTMNNSAGPVQMEVRTVSPVIFYKNENGQVQDTASDFCVVVNNVGGGDVGYSGEDDTVRLEWDSTGVASLSPRDGKGEQVKVELVNGRGTECFDIDFGGQRPARETQIDVFFTADYSYEIEDSTTVTVQTRN